MKTLPLATIRHARKLRKSRASNSEILGAQSGQSFIELALVLPILLVLAIGVIELGRYAYISILVGNAARAGAAYGAQGLPQAADTNGIIAAADNDFQNNGQNVSNLTVTSSNTCGCDSAGTVTTFGCTTVVNPTAGTCVAGHWVVMVNVGASGTFNSLFNYPGIPSPITVLRAATMRVPQN